MVVTVEPGIYIPSNFEDSCYAGPNIKQYVLHNLNVVHAECTCTTPVELYVICYI